MTIGEKLAAIRARSGLSLETLAKAAGYTGRSGVQRYFSEDYDRALDPDVAMKLAGALKGLGDPKIDETEILELTGILNRFEAKPSDDLAPRYLDLPKDVPVYGTALGTFRTEVEGGVIEQTVVDRSDPIDFFLRPPNHRGRQGIYGVYIAGSSQSPRFEEGEIAFADPKSKAMIGDDVLVYLVEVDTEYEVNQLAGVLVKRLLRRTSEYVELRQFNPPVDFKVPANRVSAMHRVLTNKEMLASW